MKLKAPRGCGGVSFQGKNYPVVKGVVEVPDQALVFLEPGYGFTHFTQIFEPVKPMPDEGVAAEGEAAAKAADKKS
jgi:hypothetical protein